MDQRGGESGGGEIEGEGAAFGDSGEGFSSVVEEVLGDALLVDLLNRGRGTIDEMGEIEITDGDDEREMAREEGGRGGEELCGGNLIDDIGQEQRERPSWIDVGKIGAGTLMGGLDEASLDLIEGLEQLLKMGWSPLRGEPGADLLVKDQEAELVSRGEDDPGETECGVDGVIQFGQVIDPRSHQTTGVEEEDDPLVVLKSILPRDETSTSRGGQPGDVAKIVSWKIVAQALEVASLTALSSRMLPKAKGVQLAEGQLLATGLAQVGIDPAGRCGGIGRLPPHQSPRGAAADVEIAKMVLAATRGQQLVANADDTRGRRRAGELES